MSKKNNDFFVTKKEWSEVKDAMLSYYLEPYVQKILMTKKPLFYVDCFAGKGKFDDGKPGSPFIALNIFNACIKRTQTANPQIDAKFIELNHSEELKRNIESEYGNIFNGECVIKGKYEDNIYGLLEQKQKYNVFLYVDPFGILGLKSSMFNKISSQGVFSSLELLINFNTFGFIREGCRVLGVKFDQDDIMTDLVEYESTKLEINDKSVKVLDEIAGGEYWKEIVKKINRKIITTKEAEIEFSNNYASMLNKNFKYVLNLPLRVKVGHPPKYRMVFATNHVDGCILMADNIYKRGKEMLDIQSGGQISLFEVDANNSYIDDAFIENNFKEILIAIQSYTRLNVILANFYIQYGVICPPSKLKSILKLYEDNGLIDVKRDTPYTKTGRKSTYFADEKGKVTQIRWLM